MVREATEYRWSSAAAHAGLVAAPSFLDCQEFARMYTGAEWVEILRLEERKEDVEELRRATRLGTIFGSAEFIKQMEQKYGRVLERKKVGRPKKDESRAAAH